MKAFFSQFGTVINVHLKRSKRTSESKGYAFIMFSDISVARIAASTMDGYLMSFGGSRKGYKIPDQFYFQTWKASDALKELRSKKSGPRNINKPLDPVKLRKKESDNNAKLKKAGINYSFNSLIKVANEPISKDDISSI
ncbi:hypothetical protein MXB_2699 [Myxobolus squamalis]|nr:hypothetical protein MXB_2699 [Myxobolus squamalis]